MQFVMLINFDESEVFGRPPEEAMRVLRQCSAHNHELLAKGEFASGAPLQPSMTATKVRGAEHDLPFSDGPFAETKEHLAGFYVIECADRSEAVRIAEEIIDAQENFRGAVEVHEAIEVTGECITCF